MPGENANPAGRALDAALEKMLRSSRRSFAGCDAEMAAAYAEGWLAGTERQSFEAHLVECDACRHLATVLAEEQSAASPPKPAPAPTWWNWRWAVPAMAGVAIIGSAVFYQRQQILHLKEPVAQVMPAKEKEIIARPVAPPAPSAPEIQRSRQAPARRAEVAPRQELQRAEARDALSLPATAQPAPVETAQVEAAKGKTTDLAKAEEKVVLEKAAPAAAPAPPPAVAAPVARMAQEKPAELREADQNQKKGAMKVVAGGAEFAAGPQAALAGRTVTSYRLPGGAPIRAITQHANRIWAVSDRGQIFRSTDGGRSWETLESPTTADLVLVKWESETDLLVQDKEGNQYRVRP